MNWIEIEKKCPNAYKEFFKYSNKQSPQKFNKANLWPGEEHLYDFFDEQEIFIEIDFTINYEKEIDIKPWGYWISDNTNEFLDQDEDFINRKEAEETAFLKAFEILEKAETRQETKKVKS